MSTTQQLKTDLDSTTLTIINNVVAISVNLQGFKIYFIVF